MSNGTNSPIRDESERGVFETLRRAVESEDWARANEAVRSGWFELTAGGSETTRQLLNRVPAAELKSQPPLAMELGIAYNKLRFHRIKALRYFVAAIRAARSTRKTGLHPIDRVLIRAAESGALRVLGRTGPSVSAARAALKQTQELSDGDRETVSDLSRIYAQLGVSLFYGGLNGEALEAAGRGLDEASTSSPSNGMGSLSLLAGVNALNGDLALARVYIDYGRSGPWTDQQRNGYSGAFYRLAESVTVLERFDAGAARFQLGQLLAMTEGRHSDEHWATFAAVEATIALVDYSPGLGLAGLDEFAQLRGREGRTRRTRVMLARMRALLHLALGDPDAAEAVLRRDMPDSPEAHIGKARIALGLGQTAKALEELRIVSTERLSTRQAAEAIAIRLAVQLRLSPNPATADIVRRLGGLLERSEQRLAIALLPPRDAGRVVGALDEAGFQSVTSALPSRPLLPDFEVTPQLSGRELIVLKQLVLKRSIPDIAATLVVSENTIKSQRRAIYTKLGVASREDARAVAIASGLPRERE